MDRIEHDRREQAWREFHQWESSQPTAERSFGELLAWLDEARRLARLNDAPSERSPEEKAARIARLRRALATINPSR